MKPCQRSLRRMMEAVRCDRAQAVEQLHGEIAALHELAPIDQEPAMRRATLLLDAPRPGRHPPGTLDQMEVQAEIAELVGALEDLLGDREETYIALGGLRTQIRERITGPALALEAARREALTRLDALALVARDAEDTWPPIICDTQTAEDLLGHARHDERELPRSGRTIAIVVRTLNSALRCYQDLIPEAQAREERCRVERWTLDEMVERLDRWEEQLKVYSRTQRDDPAIEQAINDRLAQIARVKGREKRRSRVQPGRFEHAQRMLESLWELGHGTDIPVEGHKQPLRIADVESWPSQDSDGSEAVRSPPKRRVTGQ